MSVSMMNSPASNEWTIVGKAKKDKRIVNNTTTTPNSPRKYDKKQISKVPTKKHLNEPTKNEKVENETGKSKENAKKNVAKKSIEKSKTEPEKVIQPKNLQQAFSMISEKELQESCDTMALSDIARYLNSKLSVHQNEEIYFKDIYYPQSVVPEKIKAIIINAIKNNYSNLQSCVTFCLSSIGYSVEKEPHVVGYKLMIQLIASVDPSQFLNCTAKLNNIMISCQNRPPVGLSLLWGIGQAGIFDFQIGFLVWKNSMLPMIEMKHYYKYVVEYIIKLLEIHSQETKAKNISISTSEYIELITFFNTKRNIFSKDMEKILSKQSTVLRILCLEKSDFSNLLKFDKLLDELPDSYRKSNEVYDGKTKEIIESAAYLLKNKNALDSWKSTYLKYLKQSSHILNYIVNNWNVLSDNIDKKSLANVVRSLKNAYQKSSKGKLNSESEDAFKLCQNIEKKPNASKGFPWITGCFVLFVAVCGAAIAYDIQNSGSYEKSFTAQGVKKALEYGNCAWTTSLSASARGYLWLEKNAPHYYSAAAEFSKPYFELAWDMSLLVANQAKEMYSNMKVYVEEKWPAVRSTIDQYVPGLLNAVCEYSSTAWNATKNFTVYYCEAVTTYLTTKVFIDNWAPDVLRTKTAEALNTTQLYAVEYYKKFYKQVDHYSKL